MLVGMAMSADKQTVVPFIEGPIVRIFNTETNEFSDYDSPAVGLTEGRRGAVVNWMADKGVKTLCTPPGTLCELSYDRAKEKEFKFYRIPEGTTFAELKELLKDGKVNMTAELPEHEIEPSN